MSNLSDLLPAGAAAKQLTFTDSGSGISSKAPVVLNSDGTVSAVSNTAAGGGTATLFNAATSLDYNAIVYDSANNKMVIFYQDGGNSYYGTAIVGTVSGTSISYGSPVVFNSASTSYINATYDPDTSQTVTVYRDSTTYGAAIVGSVSGTSISFGSEAVYASVNAYYHNVTYDTTNDKVVIAYMDAPSGSYGKSIIGTVSGTSISYGSATTFESGSTSFIGICYDSSNDRTVISYQDGDDSYKGKAVVGTTSGTSISFGSAVTFDSGSVYETAAAFDTSVNRVLIAYRLSGSGGVAVAGEVSGTSITFGGTVLITSEPLYIMGIAFDANAGKTIIPYNTPSNTAAYRLASISGTTTTLDSEVAFNAPAQPKYPFVAYNSTEKVDVITFYNNLDNYGYSTVVQVADVTNAQDFVGVADSAISASAAGSIIVQGGTVSGPTADVVIAESVSDPILFAQDAAGNGAVAAMASATGSSNILIAYYVNDGVTLGARANAGTITSGSISYGSSAVIGMATSTIYYYAIANTSSNNKFVVFWQDQADSYIYGAVVTLTGNSISYGGTTTIYSSAVINNYDTFNATYDPDTDRVILAVCDNSDTYAYSIVIEIGSTTIDTVGTPEKIDSSSAANGYAKKLDLCYDTTENKVIATYINVGGGGSYYLRVAAGTVTGAATNSITWGSSSVVYAGDVTYPRCAYNATDQRVVIVYKQVADAKGYSSVATVSGTTVTANTPSVMYDPSSTGGWTIYYTSVAHDSYMNKMVVYMRASQGDAVYGAIDTGTNSMTWSTPPLDISADAYNPPQTEFDVGTNQVILLGAGTSLATAESYIYTVPGTITGQPLTIGTKYYVTTTGTFRSSADTPSVNAGLAISTTSLLLNGDS